MDRHIRATSSVAHFNSQITRGVAFNNRETLLLRFPKATIQDLSLYT